MEVDSTASTDMGGALAMALSQLSAKPVAQVGVVLLLTDGKPDISPAISKYAMAGVNNDSTKDAIAAGIAKSRPWLDIRDGFAALAAPPTP
ncbi:hypothetical protein ACFQ9X_12105 [Catenulispora yoronensis]